MIYHRIFDPASSLSRLQESVVNGTFFRDVSPQDDDVVASTGMLPGRSILWKYLLLFNTPLAPASSSQPPIQQLAKSRQVYVDLCKEALRAPDGSYEDWVEIPGFDTQAASASSPTTDNLVRASLS